MSPVFVEGLGAGGGLDDAAPIEPPEPIPEESQAIQEPGGPGDETDTLSSTPIEASTPGAHPSATADPSRVRRLRHLEAGAVIGAEEVIGLLGVLEVQAGYLRMLEKSRREGSEDAELVQGASEARSLLTDGLSRFLGCLREGIPDRARKDLNEVLPSMIPTLAKEVGEGVRLRVAPPMGTLPVEANVALLERALVHLVQNAREASRTGQSVRLTWGLAPRGSGRDEQWEGVRVRVEDQGDGIPREHVPWLFEPFFSTRTEGHPLRGLGLSAVQAIVEGHGGWVEVRSRLGEGTEVDLFLPLAVVPSREKEHAAQRTKESEPAEASPRILILEDEPLLAGLLAQMLERSGYQVQICETPEELERVRRLAVDRIDLLVTERTLPGGRSGKEIARKWRLEQRGLRVIVVDRRPAGSRGEEDEVPEPGYPLLRPPFEPSEIVRLVSELLDEVGPPPPDVSAGSGSHLTH